ncbi:MAG TPA: S41 family peptidase [Bacteroidales bacterium]|nr:S41 family peptidase [Bacteroidales bacterium]
MKALRNLWKKTRSRILLLVGIIGLAFGTYSFVDKDFKLLKSLDIYYTLFRELNLYYVDETDPEDLVRTSIDGMLESLDPYTVFIPESDLDEYEFMTTGEYAGIGAMIRKIGPQIIISDILENNPAQKAGIKIGDILLEINGHSVSSKSSSQINDLFKGEPNSTIELTLERPNNPKPFKKTMIREQITVSNVPYYGMVSPTVGFIRISNFTINAHVEVKNALIALKSQGAEGMILDLRGNPGGLLIEAVDIANLFIDKGQEIVRTKGKVKQWDNIYKTPSPATDPKIPLVVLVNHNSASASEIVAGALQDLDRAVVIGIKTFGKGLVQTTRELSYNTKLKVTTAKYYIPSGRCIQALDYSHRDAEGKVGYISDTLIHEFSTRTGRKVFDGGGINPDITMQNEPISRIVLNLYSRNYLFNYATLYLIKHDSVSRPSNFRFTDQDFADFSAFLKKSDFDYQTETEEALSKLKNIAEKEKYWETSKTEFTALKEKLKHDKDIDLQNNKQEITDMLKEEIMSRVYFQKGRIEISLPSDPFILQALDVLKNPTLYSGILAGTYKPYLAERSPIK